MFWFNKWYSKQRNDYNAVVRLILIGGFRLPDSHSPASTLARSRFSIHTLHTFCIRPLRLLNRLSAHLLHPSSPASQLTLPLAFLCLFPSFGTRVPKRPWPGSRRLFPRNYPLKKTQRHIDVPDDAAALATLFAFGRYLRPFGPDTTYMYFNELRTRACTFKFVI